jgi:hypothetical protein
MRAFGIIMLCILAVMGGGIAYLSAPTIYRFKLEAAFTFDGQPYTAVGYEECTYQRAWFSSGASPHRLGQPIYDGYYTTTWRESPSVVLPDGKGAIVFDHGGSCPPLPVVRAEYIGKPAATGNGSWLAYYFPDRNDPKRIWVLYDRDRDADIHSKRYVLKHYLFLPTDEPPTSSLAHNVPIAWHWYEQMSARYRSGHFEQRMEDVWFGLTACLMDEYEWRGKAEFTQVAAAGLTAVTLVTVNEPGKDQKRNCTAQHTPQISLVPSDDFGKATLSPGRSDLRWAAITTPPQYQDKRSKRWIPELCVVDEGCTGIPAKTPYWVYLPKRRVFAQINQASLETFRFDHFAVRPGDGL